MKKLVSLLCAALLLLCTGMPALAVEGEPTIEIETEPYNGNRKCTYTFPNGGVLYFGETTIWEGGGVPSGWILYESENLQGDIVIPAYIDNKPVSRLYYRDPPTSDEIHYFCLADNPEMTSVTFPETIERFGVSKYLWMMEDQSGGMFHGCNKLKEIIFTGDGPEKFPPYFFGGTSSLKHVKLPKNVALLDESFSICKWLAWPDRLASLETLELDPENKNFVMDEQGILYTADMTTVITAVQGAASRKTVTLPRSVGIITRDAFLGNNQLERIFGGADWIRGFDASFYPGGQSPLLNPFQDTYYHWSESAVKWAFDKGVMNGRWSRTFSPDTMVDRGMACTVLYRFAGLETDKDEDNGNVGGANPFPDVPRDAYYGPAVAWAAGEDIVQGCDDGLFHPADSVTREQLAAILYRYASPLGEQNGPGPELGSFEDAGDVSEYAQEAIAWAVSAGLMQGKGDNRLDPQGLATRAEMAAMMQRLQALS